MEQQKCSLSETLLISVLQEQEEKLGNSDLGTLDTVYRLGKLYVNTGRYVEAITMLNRALKGFELVSEDTDPEQYIALLFLNEGRYNEAEPLWLKVLGLVSEHDHGRKSKVQHCLGLLYMKKNQRVEAERYLEMSLLDREKRFGVDHYDTKETAKALAYLKACD